jgi:phospholipase C
VRDIEHGSAAGLVLQTGGSSYPAPRLSDLVSGDLHIAGLLGRLRQSPQWKDMAVVVTYDENGGFWDHVPPPQERDGEIGGGRARIPTIITRPMPSAVTLTLRHTTQPRF